MVTYRITYREPITDRERDFPYLNTKIIPQDTRLTVDRKIELRSSEGDIFRLQGGTEFSLEQTEEGLQPVVSKGEVFGLIVGSWYKYRTSCYSCRHHSSPPLQLLIRPSERKNTERKNTEEYLLAMGDLTVHDFDEKGRYFTICNLSGGDKAYITHDPDISSGRSRYSVEIERMSDSEWNYIHQNYLDNRKWMEDMEAAN